VEDDDLPPTTEQLAAQVALQSAIEVWADAFDLIGPSHFIGDWLIVGAAQDPTSPKQTTYWHGFSGGSQAPHISKGLIDVVADEV